MKARANERSLRDAAQDMNAAFRDAGQRAGRDFGNEFAGGFEKMSPRIQAASLKAADATRKLREETEKFGRALASGDLDKATAASNRLASAHRSHDSALRNLAQAQDLVSNGAAALADAATTAGTSMAKAAGGAGAGALVVGLGGVVSVASAASGALAVLPALAEAAGAGFVTAKIGTVGFSDALDNLKDPTKFAKALRELSPNAQQAALDIRRLVPAFDELRAATQDALFAGVGAQITQLSTQYAPAIRQMTTGIAGAFNSAFNGIASQLANPQTFGAVSTTMNNIVAAFQNLAPAVGPLTQALAQLSSAGSSFLPQLASAASQAATEFARFIDEASRSGQLQEFIERGINTVDLLIDAVKNVTELFLALGPAGEGAMSTIATSVQTTSNVMKVLGGDIEAIQDLMPNFGEAIVDGFNKIGSVVDAALLKPLRAAIDLLNKIPGGIRLPQIPEMNKFNPDGSVNNSNQWGGGGGSFATPGSGPLPTTSPFPGASTGGGIGGGGSSFGGLGTSAVIPRSGPSWGPPPSPFAWDPKVGAYGVPGTGSSSSAANSGPVTPFTGDPMSLLGGQQVTSSLYSAASSVLQSRHDVEEQQALVNKLEQSNVATQDEITKAKNDLAQKQQQQYQAELRLQEQKQSASDAAIKQIGSAANAFADIGNKLDDDLGISRGLPGIAENLTKFLGNLATAGFRGQLKAIEAADPEWQARLAAANGSAGATSPFAAGAYAPAGYSPFGGVGAPGQAMAGESARDFAHRVEMPFFQQQGFQVGDHAADKYGEHQKGALDIMVPNLVEGAKVLQQVLTDPNTYGAIFNNQVYGYGQGSAPRDYSAGHTGDPSQDHTNHVHAYFRPGGQNNITPSALGSGPSFGPAIGGPPVGGPAIGASPIGPAAGPMNWGSGGMPTMPAGVGGQGYGPGALQPGMAGQAAGAPIAPVGGPPQGGWQPAATSSQGLGSLAGSAAAMMFPGAGEAAAKAGQAVDRSVKYLGQLGGIGISGLMETFGLSDPDGGGNLQQSWLGRVAGGLAQASPSMPSSAGQAKGDQQKQVDPNTKQHGTGGGQAPGPHQGPLIHIENMNNGNRNGQQIAAELAFRQAAKGGR